MADFTSLTPAEQIRQLGKPEGDYGIDVALRLNKTNLKITEAVYAKLGLTAGMNVLEIGFGNGRLLPNLFKIARDLKYTGIDISQTMVDEARHFNAAPVAAGQAAYHLTSAEKIPAAAASFDRVFAVNVIYFWTDPRIQLMEIRRVLKKDGFSVINSTTPESAAVMPMARPELGFYVRDEETLVALHKEAGFSRVSVEMFADVVPRPDGTPWSRTDYLIIAQP